MIESFIFKELKSRGIRFCSCVPKNYKMIGKKNLETMFNNKWICCALEPESNIAHYYFETDCYLDRNSNVLNIITLNENGQYECNIYFNEFEDDDLDAIETCLKKNAITRRYV